MDGGDGIGTLEGRNVRQGGTGLSRDACALGGRRGVLLEAEREGKQTHRLPTEAEWEYACRAGTNTVYSFGDDPAALGEHSWFTGNAWDVGEKHAHGVGLKKANGFGLRDMHGNVWEWCADVYDRYPSTAVTDPTGSKTAGRRVHRGGRWYSSAVSCRSANRGEDSPDIRGYYLGFRVAATPSAKSGE
ncbi:MAG: formylglycine-generating enzyme family protein [Planctomycetales bacterium]